MFYRAANAHAADSTRRRVPPDTRVVVLIDQYRVKFMTVPEIEIVGLKTLRDVDVSVHTELVIYEGRVAKAEAGFREIAVPTERHAAVAAELEAEDKAEKDRVQAQKTAEWKRKEAEESLKRQAILSRPDQPGYKLGPNKAFKVGDAVVGFWRNKYWYQGFVIAVSRGAVTVEYSDDGTTEKLAAKPSHIRHRVGGAGRYVAPPPPAEPPPPPAMPLGYSPGQKVRVYWDTFNSWYDARVIRIGTDGTVFIRYDMDGIEMGIWNADFIVHQ